MADNNAASAKALARAGFVEVGSETSFAPGVGAEVVEHIYRLDQWTVDPHCELLMAHELVTQTNAAHRRSRLDERSAMHSEQARRG